MSKSSRIVSYMEARYEKSFTYMGETNGTFGSRTFTAQLSCPDYPEAVILASWQEEDGEEYYLDNFMAFCHHKGALQKMEEVADQVFADYQLFFRVPDVLLKIEDPKTYTLEAYLSDPLAFKTIYLLVSEETDEKAFQALMKAFGDEAISVKGLVAVPRDPSQLSGITEENVVDFLASPDRVQTQVNFDFQNGILVYEDWRYE